MEVPVDPRFRDFIEELQGAASTLSQEISELVRQWLGCLPERLDCGTVPKDPKIFNDPVWGSIILQPAEIVLLDTPLLQRLRGVRQLGMAHYVFPGAVYDRLEHIRGVVEGSQRIITALDNSIARQRVAIPRRKDSDVEAIRLAALLHDIGHGPFSHATEDLIAVRYEANMAEAKSILLAHFDDTLKVSPAELLAILMITSEPLLRILTHPRFPVSERESLPAIIVGALLGSSKYLDAQYLAGVVSGPIDADKLDYMARDSHHAGLTLGLETDRLMTQLQVAAVTAENSPNRELRIRASEAEKGRYYDLAISRAGVGAYEQMVVGRAILYDRMYYHHKVRVAESMVRRLVELSERDNGAEYGLPTLMPTLSDETFLCSLGGVVATKGYAKPSSITTEIAEAILHRNLYHRAFAFSTRYLAGIDALDGQQKDDTKSLIGRELQKIAADPDLAKSLEKDIAKKAKEIAAKIGKLYLPSKQISEEQIIVDIPRPDKVSVRGQDILVLAADGHVELPNLYFDPEKWAQAYRANKLCGFVFCPKESVPAVNLAAKIVFAENLGLVVTDAADRQTKTSGLHAQEVLDTLVNANLLTLDVAERIRNRETQLARFHPDDIEVPKEWVSCGDDVRTNLVEALNGSRRRGYTNTMLREICSLLKGLTHFFDVAYSGGTLKNVKIGEECKLQSALRDHLRSMGFDVKEAQHISGGQQDLLFNNYISIENKIHKDPTDSPLTVGGKYGWQARRYSIPTSNEIIATVVGYQPRSEKGHKLGKESIDVRCLNDKKTIEIRLVVPVNYTSPSAVKVI